MKQGETDKQGELWEGSDSLYRDSSFLRNMDSGIRLRWQGQVPSLGNRRERKQMVDERSGWTKASH